MNDSLLPQDNEDPVIDPNKDYLTELVGDNRKFKTVDDLARGKMESDIYIRSLERGRDQLREDYMRLRDEYNARAKLEEVINQMSKPQDKQVSEETNNTNQVKPYDPKEIESLVSNKAVEAIREYERNKQENENFNLVRNKLQEYYGENYKSHLANQIRELGISDDEVNILARSKPQMLIKALGLDKPPVSSDSIFNAPPRSSRTDNFAPQVQKRTWSWYEKMRKDEPKKYWDPKVQVQMHRDHATLGKDFEDGNFSTY